MNQLTRVLLLIALVVPVGAYVAGTLAAPGQEPADHSPVILDDTSGSPATQRPTGRRGSVGEDATPSQPGGRSPGTSPSDRRSPQPQQPAPSRSPAAPTSSSSPDDSSGRGGGDDEERDDEDEDGPAHVVTPLPTPIGEDDDDEWDDERDDGSDDEDSETEQDDD